MVKAVIFDMDGVIVDSEPMANEQYIAFVKELGHDINDAFLHSTYGFNTRKFWETVKSHHNIAHDIDDLIKDHQAHMLAFWHSVDSLEMIEGIPALLARIKRLDLRLALASSANSKRIPLFLRKLGLMDTFEVVVSGDDIKRSKPAPDIYLAAAEKLSVDPKNCVAIEDAKAGAVSAKAAGMKVIGYKAMHSRQDLSEPI